jgi:dihydroxyacetone kinase
MTYLVNSADAFVEEMLDGLVSAYPRVLMRCRGGVIRTTRPATGKVAVVAGGGSGHYPAFVGIVGPGMADGAVVGEIFTSPSASQAEGVCAAVDSGQGVVLVFGNYAGDVLNFGAAQRNLAEQGHDVRCITVTDDIVSDAAPARRRGIAGDLFVFKIAGAAADAGYDLDDVEAVARRANAAVRSYGIAFSGCTLPGATRPLFTVPNGQMSLGLGVHGEPGVGDSPLRPAAEIAAELTGKLLAERPPDAPRRVAVIVNGLGSVKYEELFVLWNSVRECLTQAGLEPVEPEVGEFVTSLDMAGCSVTLAWLDDELERFWIAPCAALGFHRGRVEEAGAVPRNLPDDLNGESAAAAVESAITTSATGQEAGEHVAQVLAAVLLVLQVNQAYLCELDAVAGDGDHGTGMVRGATAAVRAARELCAAGAGAHAVLAGAGVAWGDRAGGTSGALWGAGLQAFAIELPANGPVTATQVQRGFAAALSKVTSDGGAKPGDKTLVDALVPFVETLGSSLSAGLPLAAAWRAGADEATAAAAATAQMGARLGRARVLAARSVGAPDPGATSLALALAAAAGRIAMQDGGDDG